MYSALVLYQYEAELAVSALLLEEKEYDVCDFVFSIFQFLLLQKYLVKTNI